MSIFTILIIIIASLFLIKILWHLVKGFVKILIIIGIFLFLFFYKPEYFKPNFYKEKIENILKK